MTKKYRGWCDYRAENEIEYRRGLHKGVVSRGRAARGGAARAAEVCGGWFHRRQRATDQSATCIPLLPASRFSGCYTSCETPYWPSGGGGRLVCVYIVVNAVSARSVQAPCSRRVFIASDVYEAVRAPADAGTTGCRGYVVTTIVRDSFRGDHRQVARSSSSSSSNRCLFVSVSFSLSLSFFLSFYLSLFSLLRVGPFRSTVSFATSRSSRVSHLVVHPPLRQITRKDASA